MKKKKNLYFLIACIVLLLASMYPKTLEKVAVVYLSQKLEQIPRVLGEYIQADFVQPFGDIYNPTADDLILRKYLKIGVDKPIYVYLGYWESQDEQKEIRSPRYTTESWRYYWIETKTVIMGDKYKIQVKEFLNERTGEKELVYYGYIIDGQVVPDEYRFRFLEAVNSLLYRKNNAALLRVSTPITNDFPVEMAEPYIEDFLKDFLPIVKEYLAK